MNKCKFPAKLEELDRVLLFIEEQLDSIGCTFKIKSQINIAVEEIFVNIVLYAYPSKEGETEICFSYRDQSKTVNITFIDSGIPYNPLEKEDPDITLPAQDREIGGLGFYMVKKSMDQVMYEYKEEKNHLTLIKKIDEIIAEEK